MESSFNESIKKQDREVASKQRSLELAKELFRKTIHLGSALVPLMLLHFPCLTLALLVAALVIYTLCETLILKGIKVPLVSAIISVASRKRDEGKFVLGPVTLCIGILLASLLYEHKAASVGIYALAFGDGLASLFGKLFGKVKIPFTNGKTAAGSLTCFAAIFISCFLVTKECGLSLLVASVGMFIEVMPLKDWDNVLIPILLGGIVQLWL